jgi:hypothetical protein
MGASFSASIQQLWFAVYVAYTYGKASRNTSDPTMTNMLRTNFFELRYGEVRRILLLLRTRLNKGMKKGLEATRCPQRPYTHTFLY